MTSSEKQQRVQFSFGVPISKAGEKQLIFASNKDGFQILKLDQPYYMLVGDYHGKLISTDSGKTYKQQLTTSESEILSGLSFTQSELSQFSGQT